MYILTYKGMALRTFRRKSDLQEYLRDNWAKYLPEPTNWENLLDYMKRASAEMSAYNVLKKP